jgi:hypothetical protein
VPTADPQGDPPGFFIAALRRRAGAPRFFDPPGGRR